MTTSNLSDELSELEIASEVYYEQEDYSFPATRSCIQVESVGCSPILQKRLSCSPQQQERSSRVRITPIGLEMQGKLQALVDKQQSLIDWLKNENRECLLTAEKWKREHDSVKKKLEELVSDLTKSLALVEGDLDKAMKSIRQAVRDIKHEQSVVKNRSEATLPPIHEEKHRQRNGHTRSATGLFIEERSIVETKSKQSNHVAKYRDKDEPTVNSLQRELDELREENRKLKQSNKAPIPVFVTSPKERRVDIVVEKVVQREKIVQKIVEKIVEVQKIVYKDRAVFVEKIVQRPVPVVIEKIKEVEVDRPVRVEVQRIVIRDAPARPATQQVVQPIFVDRQVQVEKLVYLNSSGKKLVSCSCQTHV